MSNPGFVFVPAAIDLSTDGNSSLEALFTFGVIALVATLLLIGKWRVEHRNLPSDQKRHARAFIGQLESQTPTTLSWRPSELTGGDYGRQTVREALAATPGADVQTDRATMRQAVREVSAAWTTGIQSLTQRLPVLAVRLLTLAGGIVVFGPIAVYALDTWRAAVQGDGGLQLGVLVDALAAVTSTFTGTAADLILAFPFVGKLWAFAFSLVIITWEIVYSHPLVTASALVLTAIAVTWLDRRLVTESEYRRDRVSVVTIPRVFAAVVGLWALGVAPTAVGSLLGAPIAGASFGLAAAMLALLGMLAWTVHEFYRELRRDARIEWPSDPDRLVVAWVVAKRIGTALVALGAVLIPAYILNVALTGRIIDILGIIAAARVEIKILIGVIAVVAVGVAAFRARSAWPDLRVAIGDLSKDRGVKMLLFGSGMPFVALGAVYVFSESVTGSTPISLAFALLAGVGVRAGYMLLRAIRYRASLLESEDTPPLRVVDHCYQLTDADGRSHYLARVNGTDLAHRDIDTLADAVADAHRDVLDPDTDGIRPSVSKQFARHLQDLGIVHVESDGENTPSTNAKLRAEVRRRTYGSLKENDRQMPVGDLREAIGELPADLVDDELTRYEIEGTSEGTVLVDDGYAWLV